ncbi:LLM class flavin-dependent oxidoreductase [Niallia taxi]|uniref:LLM class flavin-dependent oxidoreductase n=1 Tax=Niallia taxi TaxID=2499688 RepID=A0A3S2TTV7_9BACI|nr:LLM class flavin-dependent oxidoreductase [Niallia taxi]MCM3214531.1 LLM class flavin-dependent oxidoreductase [Niallia taxi]MCT2346346.1 LLM class flavin-dependent oxidoreductase [Niallia taxi]MED3964979.1 LLM class flavin-dependent oxidoreductase [Niallia taxi]MED4038630.1 LLM class flavin-dependent oxidoreductase [Niallia taxi]RVT56627.1 LLM class flavin-dependent oxidoreductase [Niallia taxi]
MSNINIPVSVLNLAPIRLGQGEKEAIDAMVNLAQATEDMGYSRYWIAEHHNSPTLVSSATSILIKHTLEHTKKIKVGSGGIMLPNHSPLVVAEQFGTMAVLYPDRLDLGLGRAPGTDMKTASALRRAQHDTVYTFPEDVQALLTYFGPEEEQGYVRAYPGANKNIPLYILGSSTDSAYLAAQLGLPYVFAAHFAPGQMEEAISIYKRRFKPSQYLAEPYMIVCLNVIAAETDEDAKREATTMQQFFLNVVRGTRTPLSPPVDSMEAVWSMMEREMATSMSSMAFIGSKNTVKEQLESFQEKYDVNEIMAVSYIYDEKKQIRSYEIFKEIVDGR